MEILDRKRLFESVGGDPERLREIVDRFLSSTDEILEAIRTAVKRADHDALQRDAHQMRGALANVGAQAAVAAAMELETLGRNGILSGIEEAMGALDREMERLKPELRTLSSS